MVAASAMPRNAAALSVADVMRRVNRLRAVRRSARSSAFRRCGLWGSEAIRARRAGLGRCGLLNVEVQSCVRPAERLLDGSRRLGAGEDEPEILPTLGKRYHVLARMHRDRD